MSEDPKVWRLLRCGACTYVARATDIPDFYDPVYELTLTPVATPKGIIEVEGIRPLGNMPSWKAAHLEPDTWTHVSSLSQADQNRIAQSLEAMTNAERTRAAGLVLAQ